MGDVEKEERLRERQSPVPAGLDSSSQLDVSIVSSAKETMLSVLELVPQSTWLLSWNTLQLRFLSWLATLPVTTRRPGLSPDTCSWPSGMTRNSTSSLLVSPSPRVVFSPTSRLSSSPRSLRRLPRLKLNDRTNI